jgi:predicted dehydrogenase
MSGVNTGAKPLRFGVLGAAHINSNAIISPCRSSPQDAIIAALAARDKARALEHVKEHSLQGCEVFDSYQDLLDNADIDAVYVPSPNGLHYEWTMKALEAGFHVLVEKPFASNAEEARIMVRTAKERHLVLMECGRYLTSLPILA